MMTHPYFNPFEDLIFDERFCFLTGDLTNEKITVFPDWLMEHFKFGEDSIEMIDKSRKYTYRDLQLPVSARVKKAFENLEDTIKAAYQGGFEAMNALDDHLLFLWIGKIVYGLLYLEMRHEQNQLLRIGENFDLSPTLRERFGNFHLMLLSIIEPVTFSGQKPWSIVVFPLKYSADIFSFRDDPINLLFSFGVNKFGIIACLQDNGVISEKEKDILEKIKGHTLHPIQFEELYARFHYSDYILQYAPKYRIETAENKVIIQGFTTIATEERPLFGFWDEDIFAQLLSNYWSVYGLQREDILQFQKPIVSFLEKPYTKEFILPESIDLPY